MKATINTNLICTCGAVLAKVEDKLTCRNEDCKNYGKKFEKPSITLKEAKGGK